jgi:glycosyltransferase involved in cell wall biosynthesis
VSAARAQPRIGLDAQLTLGTATGIGEYVTGLGAALRARGCDVASLAQPALDPWRFDRRVLWDQIGLPLAALAARVDVLHCAAGTLPLVSPLPIVATVHDVAWLRVQQHTRPYARAYFGRFQLARYAAARVLFVDSVFSRNELLSLVPLEPERVVVLYPGVATDIMNVVRVPLAEPTLLAVGTVEARKNLEVLVRVVAAIPHVRLISVGPFTPYRLHVLALAEELGVSDRVDLRGYVTRPELLALYASATVAAVPSLYEGFGYGAAQALCAGVPLVAADAAALPEIVAGGAALVPPQDARGWTDAVAQVLGERERAERSADAERGAASARFGWLASAAAAQVAYERVYTNRV